MKIKNIDEFKEYLNNIKNNIDDYQEFRDEMRHLFFEKIDGKTSRRIVDYFDL